MAVSKPDFTMQFGSAKSDLTPVSASNYAQGWDYVGSTPPTKNDFTYLQYLADQRSLWLNENKAALAGSATQVFRVMQSDSDTNAAVPLGQLQFNVTNLNNSIAQRALTAGNSNQQFSVANATSNSQAVNLSQLNSGLAAKTNQADFMGGTNGNGVWYLLPNGMQICRFNIAVRAAGSDTWTYPRQFNSAPQCLYTVVAPSSDASKALWINGVSGTSVTFYNPNTILVNINLVAIL